jgi:BirA family biotin operon repressor/biotin-[acetyl-CoA-carboxylase] ligase
MKFTVHHFDTLDSTNKFALEKCSTLENYSVIVATMQTAGKGRNGKKWLSNDGENLYFSLVLKPDNLTPTESSTLPQLMSLAVYNTLLKAELQHSWIKWPNDIFVKEKKICGILCEAKLKNNSIDSLIIGVGINVNASKESLSKIDVPATSILNESSDKKPFIINEILHYILAEFDKNYQIWLNPKERTSLQEQWRQASKLIGKAVKLSNNSETIYGTVVDFTTLGELILQTENGFKTFSCGDLSLRPI